MYCLSSVSQLTSLFPLRTCQCWGRWEPSRESMELKVRWSSCAAAATTHLGPRRIHEATCFDPADAEVGSLQPENQKKKH